LQRPNVGLGKYLPTPFLDKVKSQIFFQIIFLFLHFFPFNHAMAWFGVNLFKIFYTKAYASMKKPVSQVLL